MKFKAYALNMRTEDVEMIRRIGESLTREIVDIVDLSKHNIQSDSDDVLLLFGAKAEKASEGKSYLAKLVLPEIEKLDSEFGDPEERKAARAALKTFKGKLGSITNSQRAKIHTDVPTEASVPAAPQTQDKGQIEAVTGINSEGKVVKLSEEPESNTADVNLTFAEFTALDRFMTVFGVKETKIVYKPSASSRKSSTS